MKAVLISIRPWWCYHIASGKKTIEVRKSAPKIETPFKVYIYCTNTKPFLAWGDVFRGNWETEFTFLRGYSRERAEKIWDLFNGHVIGEFVCDRVYRYASDMFRTVPVEGTDISTEDMTKFSCLTAKELYEYEHSAEPKENCINLVGVYGWHISDLKIYDDPKPLRCFHKPCPYRLPDGSRMDVPCPCDKYTHEFDEESGLICCTRRMKKPPQSWCYVEELNGKSNDQK